MTRHRQMAFVRRVRRLLVRGGWLVVVSACLGAFVLVASERLNAPTLVLPTTTLALAVSPADASMEASITARVQQDLPMLEDLWSVGGGPAAGVHYVEAPEGIKAGKRLHVDIRAVTTDGRPFAGAFVEVLWKLGSARYRDVTYTDDNGVTALNRVIDPACEGTRCVVAVRMFKDDLQGLAYSTFWPK
jgi:hypothetical protein